MKLANLAFIGTLPALSKHFHSSKCLSVVNFDVGGYKFSIDAEDLHKHPSSLLSQLSQSAASGQLIPVNRDGELFKYVNAFLVNGQLPRDRQGVLTMEAPLLEKLHAEADFYGLDSMKEECTDQAEKPLALHLQVYQKMRNFITGMGRAHHQEQLDVVHSAKQSLLIHALHNALEPAYARGDCSTYSKHLLGGAEWSINDLLEMKRVENPNLTLQDSFDLAIQSLNIKAVDYIGRRCLEYTSDIFPRVNYELKPTKLSVHTSSAPEIQFTPTDNIPGQIGTLIVFLTKDYTGGDIHVRSDDKCEDVIPHEMGWVAVHSVCSYKMNRVTSGTRVALIYSIMRTGSREHNHYRDLWYSQYDWKGYRVRDRTTIDQYSVVKLLSAVDEELAKTSSIIIATRNVYPVHSTRRECLKGGDRALYDLLCEHYDVQVVCTSVYHTRNYYDEKYTRVEGDILTPEIIHKQMGSPIGKKNAFVRQTVKPSGKQTKLFLHHELKSENVMHFIPCTEWGTSNGEAVYLVSGLQVRKKQ